MASSSIVVAAVRYVGTVESPPKSNCQPFSRRLGYRCQPWCADFVTCVYLDCQIDLRQVLTPAASSCAAILAAARSKHWTVPRDAALPGDLVLFQFDRDRAPDHIEIVESVAGGTLRTIGGNTGSRTHPADGGAVARQARSWSTVVAVVRVPIAPRPPLHSNYPPIPAPPHPNPDAHTPPPPRKDDDMPGYLFSDGQQVWLTDGLTKRRVPYNGDRFHELLFLGQARNSIDSAGNIDVPLNPTYLASIPEA